MKRSTASISLLEQQVMLAVLRLHPNGYGVSIRNELQARTKQSYALGSIYACLDRLEDKGFLKPREGEATPERGGRKKMYFELTGLGQQTLDQSLRALDSLRVYQALGTIARRFVLREA